MDFISKTGSSEKVAFPWERRICFEWEDTRSTSSAMGRTAASARERMYDELLLHANFDTAAILTAIFVSIDKSCCER